MNKLDILETNIKNAKPKNVSIAINLMYISLGISFISDIIFLKKFNINIIIIMAIVFPIAIYFIYLIAKKRNWARILYSIIFVFSLPNTIKDIMKNFNQKPFNYMVVIINSILIVIAITFLFTKDSNLWFKNKTVEDKVIENS